jgi:hypothetical protein
MMTKYEHTEIIELSESEGITVNFIALIGNGEGVEEVTWDNSLFYEWGNKLIQLYVDAHYTTLSMRIFGLFLAEMEKTKDDGFYSGKID